MVMVWITDRIGDGPILSVILMTIAVKFRSHWALAIALQKIDSLAIAIALQKIDSLAIAMLAKAMGLNGYSTHSLAKICHSVPLIMFSSHFFHNANANAQCERTPITDRS